MLLQKSDIFNVGGPSVCRKASLHLYLRYRLAAHKSWIFVSTARKAVFFKTVNLFLNDKASNTWKPAFEATGRSENRCILKNSLTTIKHLLVVMFLHFEGDFMKTLSVAPCGDPVDPVDYCVLRSPRERLLRIFWDSV